MMTSINCLVSDHQLQNICPLQIQKELSQALTRRRSCNTMAKQKRTKGQTLVDKTLHKMLEIAQHEGHHGLAVEC